MRAITSLVPSTLISKLFEVIIKASGTVMSVVSPALTSLPVKSKLALIRNVAHCPNSPIQISAFITGYLNILNRIHEFTHNGYSGVSADVFGQAKSEENRLIKQG